MKQPKGYMPRAWRDSGRKGCQRCKKPVPVNEVTDCKACHEATYLAAPDPELAALGDKILKKLGKVPK